MDLELSELSLPPTQHLHPLGWWKEYALTLPWGGCENRFEACVGRPQPAYVWADLSLLIESCPRFFFSTIDIWNCWNCPLGSLSQWFKTCLLLIPQGQFSINLTGTGLQVAEATKWVSQGNYVSVKVHRSEVRLFPLASCSAFTCEHLYSVFVLSPQPWILTHGFMVFWHRTAPESMAAVAASVGSASPTRTLASLSKSSEGRCLTLSHASPEAPRQRHPSTGLREPICQTWTPSSPSARKLWYCEVWGPVSRDRHPPPPSTEPAHSEDGPTSPSQPRSNASNGYQMRPCVRIWKADSALLCDSNSPPSDSPTLFGFTWWLILMGLDVKTWYGSEECLVSSNEVGFLIFFSYFWWCNGKSLRAIYSNSFLKK